MEIVRARHKGEKHIYVHNDILNAAHNLKELIERRLAADDRKGLAFSYMSCMVMISFSVEAAINFLGYKLITDWKERQSFNDKLDQVLAALNLTPDRTSRPYKSIATLKEFRDMIAHGKPLELEFDEIVEAPREEIERKIDLDHGWQGYCSHNEVWEAYEDVNAIWKEWLEASELEPFDTITHGSSGLTLLEIIEVATTQRPENG